MGYKSEGYKSNSSKPRFPAWGRWGVSPGIPGGASRTHGPQGPQWASGAPSPVQLCWIRSVWFVLTWLDLYRTLWGPNGTQMVSNRTQMGPEPARTKNTKKKEKNCFAVCKLWEGAPNEPYRLARWTTLIDVKFPTKN